MHEEMFRYESLDIPKENYFNFTIGSESTGWAVVTYFINVSELKYSQVFDKVQDLITSFNQNNPDFSLSCICGTNSETNKQEDGIIIYDQEEYDKLINNKNLKAIQNLLK
jgi:hypothetical protein